MSVSQLINAFGLSQIFSIFLKYSYYQSHYISYSFDAFLLLLLDLYRDLDRYSNQGIENYGVSMTTLNEVFLKLEGKSAIDESGKKRFEFYISMEYFILKIYFEGGNYVLLECNDLVWPSENVEQIEMLVSHLEFPISYHAFS